VLYFEVVRALNEEEFVNELMGLMSSMIYMTFDARFIALGGPSFISN